MSDIVTLNGYKIKDEKAVRSYETVALMKADTKLKEGYHVKTKGYYEANDGGHGEYVIVDDDTLVDDGGSVHDLDNGLFAKLINKENVNVKQFGAKGNGTDNDTRAIQSALTYGKKVSFEPLTYLITSPLTFSNNKVIGNNAILITDSTFTNIDYLICLQNNNYFENIKFDCNDNVYQVTTNSNTCNNIEFNNCEFTGCKENINEDVFSLNSCIFLDAKDLIIRNCKIHDNWSHGIRLYQSQDHSNVLIDNCEIYNNGYINTTKIASVGIGEYTFISNNNFDSVKIVNTVAYHNGATGIAPHSVSNCFIDNCVSHSNGEHGYCLMAGIGGSITNCKSYNNESFGVRIQGDYTNNFIYQNFILNNLVSKNEKNIYITSTNGGLITNCILSSNVSSQPNIIIGDMWIQSDNSISNITIKDNILNNDGTYPIEFHCYDNASCHVVNNNINGKLVNGFYKTSNNFTEINDVTKYGTTNNILLTPEDFSSNWTLSHVDSDKHTITPSNGYVCRQLVSNVNNPKYVGVLIKVTNPTIELNTALLLRDSEGTLLATMAGSRYYSTKISQIGIIYDIQSLNLGTEVSKIEVQLKTADTTETTPIYVNGIYACLGNELPILPN